MQNIIPYKPTAFSFIFKILSGFAGGIIGMLIITVIFFLSSSILQPAFLEELEKGEIHELFIVIFMSMMFLSVTTSSLVSTILSALSEKGKYTRLSTAIYQIFIINIIVFLFLSPLYFIFFQINIGLLGYIAGLHIILSAMAATLILEIVGNTTHAILGVYGTVFGLVAGIGINIFVFQITGGRTEVILFTALPVTWICLTLFSGLVETVYYGLYTVYGMDFLKTEMVYGADIAGGEDDEATEEEVQEKMVSKKKDKTGAEFLKDLGEK